MKNYKTLFVTLLRLEVVLFKEDILFQFQYFKLPGPVLFHTLVETFDDFYCNPPLLLFFLSTTWANLAFGRDPRAWCRFSFNLYKTYTV